MSNFEFLKPDFPDFYAAVSQAEELVSSRHRLSLMQSRFVLEMSIQWLYQNIEELEYPEPSNEMTLLTLMKQEEFIMLFDNYRLDEIHLVRQYGNYAIHNKPISKQNALDAIKYLYNYFKDLAYNYTEIIEFPLFDEQIVLKTNLFKSISNKLVPKNHAVEKIKRDYEEKIKKLKKKISRN